MTRAVGIVGGIGQTCRSVGELVGRVWKDGVPPVEELVRVAFFADWVVSGSNTGGY